MSNQLVTGGKLPSANVRVRMGFWCTAEPDGQKDGGVMLNCLETRAKRELDLAPTNDIIFYPLGVHELYHLSSIQQ